MSAQPEPVPAPGDHRARRAAATRREILDAAWALVREEGLGALRMRDLGARVGMRAQSLYVYFPSKHAIYDAMFAEGNLDLLGRLEAVGRTDDPVADLRRRAHVFVRFAVEDQARYQLLFQRTIPGFEPSEEAYRPAVEVLESGRHLLAACGIRSAQATDLYTALMAGLAAQQNANEPGGDRWVRLIDDAHDMYLAHHATSRRPRPRSRGKR